MEYIPGYDRWKTTPPDELEPIAHCAICGEEKYEGDVLYTIDGGICEQCLNDHYREFVTEKELL